MTNYGKNQQTQQGFTLIELSIVLVIIGLIVGGVLVGQDLIRAAEIRATVTQIEKYNTAVNTFRGKYNGIPGDIAAASATAFGLTAVTTNPGNAGLGDGNGVIEGGATGTAAYSGEVALFWNHLTTAGYTDGAYATTIGSAAGTITAAGALPGADTTGGTLSSLIPPAKLGRGNYLNVGSNSGINYFAIAGVTKLANSGGAITATNAMTPTEAYNIDRKTDDGLPNSGKIQQLDTSSTGTALSATASSVSTGFGNAGTSIVSTATTLCATGTGYNLATGFGTTQACSLRLQFN